MGIKKYRKKTKRKVEISVKKLQKEVHNRKNYSEEFKRQAIQIFYEGNSEKAVGRLIKINKSTVYNYKKSK